MTKNLIKPPKYVPVERSLCPACQVRSVAVNYVKDGVTHYRSRCDHCIRNNKQKKPVIPYWMKAGYRKKPACEKCGFKAKFKEQLDVYHIDGNLTNNNPLNLKTICLNCSIEVSKLGWRQGDLTADF